LPSAKTDPYAALLAHYLSPRHRDEPGAVAPSGRFSGDAALRASRCAPPSQKDLEPLIDIVGQGHSGPVESGAAAQGGCGGGELVGAVILARAVGDASLSDRNPRSGATGTPPGADR